MRLLINSKRSIRLLGSAILLVGATLAITHFRNAKSRLMEKWVEHTLTVIKVSQSLLANIGAADAIQRDFVLTSDSTSHLPGYRAALSRIDTLSSVLQDLVQDNDGQTQLLMSGIFPLIGHQKEIWDLNGTNIQPNLKIYIESIGDDRRNIFLDSLFMLMNSFMTNEEQLLVARRENLQRSYVMSDLIRWSALLATGLICLAAIFTIHSQQKTNEQLIRSLADSNISLESRVEERTNELKRKNIELEESLEEINTLNQSIAFQNSHLSESLQEVQFLYDHAPCGYHTVNLDGTIVKINKTELNWLGYTEEEVVGKKNISDFLTPEAVATRNKSIEDLKKTGHLEGLEFDLIRKDGTAMPVLLNTIAYFDERGQYVKNRSTVFDISDRKRLEENLKEANAYLVKLNEEKTRFLGMATHDLKNPIHGIFSLVNLMKLSTTLTDQHKEYIEYMETTLRRMQGLVERLLDLNKIEEVGIQTELALTNVSNVLTATYNDFVESAKKKNIDLIMCNDVGKEQLYTDASILRQILDNLLSNAIKFSPPFKQVWLRAEPKANSILFEVEDQGPGISAEDMPKLFGAFQRLSARPTDGESSSGLGLSIVKTLAQSLNTEIRVNSKVNQGTTFSFLMEIAHEDA